MAWEERVRAGRSFALLIYLCLGLGLLSACGKPVPVMRPTPTPVPLGPVPKSVLLPSGSAAPFAISGSELAWAGIPSSTGVCPQNDIYLANVRLWRPRIVWRGGQCAVISDVKITPEWVIWSAGAAPAGSIWAEQRSTGKIIRVGGQPHPLPLAQPCATSACFPSLDFSAVGNLVTWSVTRFTSYGDYMNSAIVGKVLPNGPTKVLYSTQSDCRIQTSPFVAGGRLVWLEATWTSDVLLNQQKQLWQCRGAVHFNVMTESIDGVFRHRHPVPPQYAVHITTSGLASNPQTDGRFVSYQDTLGVPASCLCSDLLVYDTRTGGVITPAKSVTDYVLSGRLLSWIRIGTSTSQVEAAQLGQKRLSVSAPKTLAVTGTPSSTRFARVFGWPSNHRLVWELDTIVGSTDRVRVIIREVKTVAGVS